MAAPIERLIQRLHDLLPDLAAEYGVTSIEVFGSYVRGEAGPASDLDVLVTFEQAPGLLRFVELEDFLSTTLGVRVDLVMRESLKPTIGQTILGEAVPV